MIGTTVLGRARRGETVSRSGARRNDLVCITGNLGAAYMGLRLLEREKRVLRDVSDPEPRFAGYEYLLEKYLKPRPRTDVLEALAAEGVRPTSMIDLSDGLASDLLQLCRASDCGVRIYLDRIPIARQTSALAEERCTPIRWWRPCTGATTTNCSSPCRSTSARAGAAHGVRGRDRPHHRCFGRLLPRYARRRRNTPPGPGFFSRSGGSP